MRKTLSLLLGASLCLMVAACGEVKRGEYLKGSATICCDDGFRNILEEEIEVFEYRYPESSIIPFYVSEEQAVDSLLQDRTQAIIVTRELTKEQIKYIKEHNKRIVRQNCIAVDAVALITNKANPVQQLSMEEVKEILSGKITSWSQLASSDTASIKLVFDNAGSSTVNFMRDKFLPKGKMISDNPNAFAQSTNAAVFDIVKRDPQAIGIISVSWLGSDLSAAKNVPMDRRAEDYANATDTVPAPTLTTEVNILRISNPTEANDFSTIGYKPYQQDIYTGEYPLFRKIYMVTTASQSSVMKSFYDFMTGFEGQKIISLTGILPYHMQLRVVTLTE